MQKRNFLAAVLLAFSTLIISCGGSDSKTFSNKNDSLAFARAVMETYAEPLATRSVTDTIPSQEPEKGFGPISWETVEDYSKRYDQAPGLKSPEGYFYQGFSIDTAGYSRIIRTKSIKGIFMRLGRKPTGDYTIMVLGTDAQGKIINTGVSMQAPPDSTNFDNAADCPNICP